VEFVKDSIACRSSGNTVLLSTFWGRGWLRGVISAPYTLTLTLSLKGEAIGGLYLRGEGMSGLRLLLGERG
jgi:hypothetical protein